MSEPRTEAGREVLIRMPASLKDQWRMEIRAIEAEARREALTAARLEVASLNYDIGTTGGLYRRALAAIDALREDTGHE